MVANARLIITGLGLLNALGLEKALFWQQLLKGRHGMGPVEGFAGRPDKNFLGAAIRGFNARAWMPGPFYRRLSRLSRLAVAASVEAAADGGLEATKENRQRLGAVFGTAFGSTEQTDAFFVSLLDHGPQGAEPILFPDTVPNAPASHVAIFHGLQGPNSTICQNHVSGECALAFARSLLELEQADALLVGGADELSPILLHSLDALGALRPFAREETFDPRDLAPGRGFLAGEAATCLVLEREATVGGQQKSVYGALLAAVITGDSVRQGHYAADAGAMTDALRMALEEAALQPGAIDIIGLAANGVAELEEAEAGALERVFGPGWQRLPRLPLRYFTGEFGAAGLLSIATILLALRNGVVPPAVYGPRLTGMPGAPRRFAPARKARLHYGLVLGATFGGASSCSIVGAPEARAW
jgi:3-oxoacyl-[acyl-carrier-protein] synthase II